MLRGSQGFSQIHYPQVEKDGGNDDSLFYPRNNARARDDIYYSADGGANTSRFPLLSMGPTMP
ncbi:MAG: hypothetical protein ACD_69C00227G0003, partial [uncultured bacterium]